MRPTSVPMAGRIQSHSTAAESRTKTNSNSRNRPKRISGKTASKNARFLRVLHFERNTRLDSATNQRLTLRHLNDCVSRRSIRARIATADTSLDRPCANQGAQRHAREFVVGGLVHEDDGQESDAGPVPPDRPPPDLHVFRRLAALDASRQEPGDRLGGQVQLVRDLLLGEALLLVLHGPLRDRVHIFHAFSNSAAHDARCRISRYRVGARTVSESTEMFPATIRPSSAFPAR